MKKKNFKKSYKRKLVKPFYKKRFFWIFITILVCLSILIYFLFFSHFFRIKNIQISGNEIVYREEIENIIEEKIFFDFLFFQPKTIFSLKTSKTSTYIEQRFLEIDSVTIKTNFPNELIVDIKERKPVAIWCKEEENDDCFLINKKGIIFRRVMPAGMVIIKGGNNNISLGENALSYKEMKALIEIWKELEDINIVSFTVSNPDINVGTAKGWNILFTFRESIASQAFKLALTMEEHIPPEKRESLDYIDVRFDNRVFFKHKNSN